MDTSNVNLDQPAGESGRIVYVSAERGDHAFFSKTGYWLPKSVTIFKALSSTSALLVFDTRETAALFVAEPGRIHRKYPSPFQPNPPCDPTDTLMISDWPESLQLFEIRAMEYLYAFVPSGAPVPVLKSTSTNHGKTSTITIKFASPDVAAATALLLKIGGIKSTQNMRPQIHVTFYSEGTDTPVERSCDKCTAIAEYGIATDTYRRWCSRHKPSFSYVVKKDHNYLPVKYDAVPKLPSMK